MTATYGDVRFYNDEATPDEILFLDESVGGNVGIGTTSPGYKLDVSGTVQATGFRLGSETVTDFSGTGISVTGNALVADLGTSIETGEITDGEILEVDLDVTNSPTDNYVLSYDSTSGGFTWVTDATGSDQNLFETIDAPSGTDPVAGSPTDTLQFLEGSNITITGNSAANSLTIAATGLDNYSSWTVADDDADTYSIASSNILRFTSSDSNVLTNLTNGDDGDENLDFQLRLNKDLVAGSGMTGGANDVLVGADGDVTISHQDTSSQADVDNSGTTVIQDVGVDGFGHVDSLTSVDLSSLFDNYQYWTFAVDGVSKDNITQTDVLDFVSGSGITVSEVQMINSPLLLLILLPAMSFRTYLRSINRTTPLVMPLE